jgi:hypothetical protein
LATELIPPCGRAAFLLFTDHGKGNNFTWSVYARIGY